MPPALLIKPESPDEERDAVLRGVQALAEGQLVVFPTETVYGIAANARNETAVQRLIEAKGRAANNPLPLAVKGEDEMLDYCPRVSVVGRRLARRCWPGPLTLVAAADAEDGLSRRFPKSVQQAVLPTGSIGFRVPGHRFLLDALRFLDGPLVLTSANRSGHPDSVSAQQALEALGDQLSIVLDDGPCRYQQPSTVVRVDGNRLELLREGVLGPEAVRRYASLMVLLVCTGNTCRSPMAEVLLRKRLAGCLGCEEAALETRGVMVMSAGIAAVPGASATDEAIQAMQAFQLDLTGHESRPVTETLVRFADLILTMTTGHRATIISQWPETASKTANLDDQRGDVPDPVGGSLEVYQRCAEQIDEELAGWVERIDLESLPELA